MGHRTIALIFVFAFGLIGLTGCSHYAAPKRAANLEAFGADLYVPPAPDTAGGGTKRPVPTEAKPRPEPKAHFPVNLAIVRIQESGYSSHTINAGDMYGSGDFSVMIIRDIETDADFERIGSQAYIDQTVTLNRLLLPRYFTSYRDLLKAADQLNTDMLLIYTVDTVFTRDNTSTPLTIITLGLSPTVEVKVRTTVSGIILDSRTGYVYGAMDATSSKSQKASALGSADAFDSMRLANETEAFRKFLDEYELTWKGILKRYH